MAEADQIRLEKQLTRCESTSSAYTGNETINVKKRRRHPA